MGRGAPALHFDGESGVEAQARLRYVVQGGLTALLVGPRGVGKSLLCNRFAQRLRRGGRAVVAVDLTGLSSREFFWSATSQLALGPRPGEGVVELRRRLIDHWATPLRQRAATWLLDNADRAIGDVLTELLRLTGDGPAIAAPLVLAVAHGDAVAGSLRDLLDLRIDIEPWSEHETASYIQHALVVAGCPRPLFDEESLSVIFSLSEGIPRRVNRLADGALLAAAAQQLDAVGADAVEAAYDGLAWNLTTPPLSSFSETR